MTTALSLTDRFTAQYDALRQSLPGSAAPWLSSLRARGLAGFAASGLPTIKNEAWKYTNLNPLAKLALVPAAPTRNGITAAALPWLLAAEAKPHRLVFVNGWFRADLSDIGALPKGVTLANLATALEREPEELSGRLGALGSLEEQPMLALNTALLADGFLLRLGRDAALERPVELLFVASPGSEPVLCSPRNLIIAEPGSRAVIVERHVSMGSGAYLANGAMEIEIAEGAEIRHYRAVTQAAQGFHLSTTQVRLEARARYESFVLADGGKLTRNEIQVTLGGRNASCQLNGAYMGQGREHIDNTTMIDHACPETTSRQLYKGVLDNYARGVFQGRVLVRPDAQKTDGQQTSRTLLLSEGAEIDTKPELEIYADDVKCSHGAAAGELESDALFYLRSRGIPEAEARRMLVEAFLFDVVDDIGSDVARASFHRLAAGWVAEKSGETE